MTASARDHNIDIICIQEHRYTHCEDIKHHDSFLYIYIKYIVFSLVGFYVISTIVGYLKAILFYK